MRKVLIVVFLSLFQACRKNGRDTFPEVQIHYADMKGNDLFINGTINNGYSTDSIRIFDYQNGIKKLIYYPNAVLPYGYSLSPFFSSTIVISDGNNDIINQNVVTIIHLKPGVDDTLKLL